MAEISESMSSLPDLGSLLLFLRIVDSGSLSRAASQSHIVLSAASRRIAALEEQLGVALLLRTPKGMKTTMAGAALAEHARNVLRGVGQLQADLLDYSRGAKGRIRLLANSSVMAQEMPRTIASFSNLHPDILLHIREQSTPMTVAALRERSADIGVCVEGVSFEGLTVYPYRPDRLVAIVPRDHPLRGKQVDFVSLLDFQLVGLDDAAANSTLFERAAHDAGKPLRLRVQVRSAEAVCQLIASGVGIGLLPQGAVERHRKEMGLRLLPLTDAWAVRQLFVCLPSGAVSKPAAAMVQHILRHGAA